MRLTDTPPRCADMNACIDTPPRCADMNACIDNKHTHSVQTWPEQGNACIDIPPRCAAMNACTDNSPRCAAMNACIDNSPRCAVMVRAGECVYNQHIHAWIKHIFPLFETDGGRGGGRGWGVGGGGGLAHTQRVVSELKDCRLEQ